LSLGSDIFLILGNNANAPPHAMGMPWDPAGAPPLSNPSRPGEKPFFPGRGQGDPKAPVAEAAAAGCTVFGVGGEGGFQWGTTLVRNGGCRRRREGERAGGPFTSD